MKKIGMFAMVFIVITILAGCSLVGQNNPTPTATPPTVTPAVFPTEIPQPTVEITLPAETPTTGPTATQAPILMLNAVISEDGYSLRAGPGRMFQRLFLYDQGAVVTLIGREVSDNWVLVQTADHRSGWMSVEGLNVVGGIDTLPVFKVDNAQVLHGHVYTTEKTPATAVEVNLTPSDKTISNYADHSYTNDQGEWIIYVPTDTHGSYQIGSNGWTCAKSNISTPTPDGCKIGGNLPPAQMIALPLTQDVAIEFQIVPLP